MNASDNSPGDSQDGGAVVNAAAVESTPSGDRPSDALAALAAAIGSLSAADRAALVAMIGQAPTPNEPTPQAGPFNRCENGAGSGEGP